MKNSIIKANIERQLNQLRMFTSTPGNGITRFPFTDEAMQASKYISEEMKQAGMSVYMDNSGSIIGRIEGETSETIMIGSHLDSVQCGGAYDGIAGVVCGIEAAKLLLAEQYKPYYSIEVIATNDEEGSRFKSGLFTGKVMNAMISVDDIKRFKDKDGISMYKAMEDYGLKPDEIASHKRNDIKAFLEVHIEQGPILEAEKKEIGIVDIIVGIKRVIVTINGRQDHVGTMPMNMRKDAMEVAAKVIAEIGDCARQYPLTVATVGNLNVEPNIINVIPSKVTFSIDFRATTKQIIDEQYNHLVENLKKVTGRFDMTYDIEETLDVSPVDMNKTFGKYIEESCKDKNVSFMHMVSGAGHDAEIFGEKTPAAMIFVPSIGGRSHCPEENTDESDLVNAAIVACDVIKKICQDKAI